MVENVPLRGAFGDDAALALDLLAGGLVEPLFGGEQVFGEAADLLAGVGVAFEELDVVESGQRLGGGGGQLVELLAREPHSTALYFFTSSTLTFLNISA